MVCCISNPGAGVVADPGPGAPEYQETISKASALVKAAEIASGFSTSP